MLDVMSLSANRYHVSWPCVIVNAACRITLSLLGGTALSSTIFSSSYILSPKPHH